MARPKKKQVKQPQQQKTSFAPRKPESSPLMAVGCFALGLFFLVALIDFDVSQSTLKAVGGQVASNVAGALGGKAADYSLFTFGIATWLIPAFLFWVSYLSATKKAQLVRFRLFIAFIACLVSATGIAQLVDVHFLHNDPMPSAPEQVEITTVAPGTSLPQFFDDSIFLNGIGGSLGKVVIHPSLVNLIGIGTALLVVIIFFASLLVIFADTLAGAINAVKKNLAEREKRRAEHRQKAIPSAALKKTKKETKADREPIIPKAPALKGSLQKKEVPPAPKPSPTSRTPVSESVGAAGHEDESLDEDQKLPLPKRKKKKQVSLEPPPPKPAPPRSNLTIIASEATEKASINIPRRKGDYEFPPLELLAEAKGNTAEAGAENHQETAESLIQTLDEFGVKVSPSEVHTGPVITRYEIVPAAGVRVEKILNLDKNIALGLRAEAVRILAPVPGKGTVGIEVPNKNPVPVCMREIIESKAWAASKAEIPVVLGKDVTGKPIVEDLTKMPHMLIAGSTGSGKTVCINAIIASLLYHSSPADLRFIMVDPKVVEMQVYNALPHMLIPVVTDPKKVPGALKYLINEMERRYQIFAKVGVRNIAGFNAKVIKNKEEKAKAAEHEAELDAEMSAEERVAAANLEVPRDLDLEIPDTKMHYIVCIIDELADLMMVAPQDIETGVARIAQLARAAGIHLILATQRPSVNVITGVIKANLPTRISFKVASKVDSRTILDGGGAEALIGKGDMLFVPPGTSNLVRAQGAFVSDDEINAIVEFLQTNGPPEFVEDIQRQIDGEDEASLMNNTYEDELVPDAIGVLKASKRASTSMLQRRLKIGYNRAARIMEILEDEGIVGPENGSSPREILKDLDML